MRLSLEDGELPLVELGAGGSSSSRRSTTTTTSSSSVDGGSDGVGVDMRALTHSFRRRKLAVLLAGALTVSAFLAFLAASSSSSFLSESNHLHLPPWAQPLVRVRVCDDSCPSARDGRCDDGRFLSPRAGAGASSLLDASSSPTTEVKCDVGTDCSDCGGEPWEAWLPEGLATVLPRPIAELRGEGARGGGGEGNAASASFRVFVTRTATDPPFAAVHADPELDVDVSAQLASLGAVERGLTQVWRARLKRACSPPPPSSRFSSSPLPSPPPASLASLSSSSSSSSSPISTPLVLDVGANFGYYSLFAAALGCRVVAWEPVPRFRSFFEAALLLNPKLAQNVELRGAAACDRDDSSRSASSVPSDASGVTLTVPERGVWGTASVGGANIDRELERREEERRAAAAAAGGEQGSGAKSSSSPPPPSRPSRPSPPSPPPSPRLVQARCERVDAAIESLWSSTRTPFQQRKIALMKVDVEGYEPAVLSGAARLFDTNELGDADVDDAAAPLSLSLKKREKKIFSNPFSFSKFGAISDVVLEYSPGIPERNNAWEALPSWPAMLLFLKSKGFVLANLPFGGAAAAAGEDLLRGDWEAPLPSFEEVTLENLAADASDAEKLRHRTLGCPLPRELFAFARGEEEGAGANATAMAMAESSLSHPAAFSRCNAIPEQLHPHSFRATFGHNTNVWAARKGWVRVLQREEEEGGEGGGAGGRGGAARGTRGSEPRSSRLLRLGQPVGVFGPFDPLTSWFPTTRSGVGMGGRSCAALPAEVRVAHRCPCVPAEQREDEEEEAGGSDGKKKAAAAAAAKACGAEEALVASLAKRGLMPPLHGASEASVALLGGR